MKKVMDPYTGETTSVTDELAEVLQAAVEHPEIVQQEIDREVLADLRSNGICVGDTVRSKNPDGQVKISGTVVALIEANFYVDYMLNMDGKRIPYIDPGVTWGKTCPNWRQQYVAIVFFNIPQRSATKQEWCDSGVIQGFRREDCEANYERQCPMIQQMVLPVGDLELIGE